VATLDDLAKIDYRKIATEAMLKVYQRHAVENAPKDTGGELPLRARGRGGPGGRCAQEEVLCAAGEGAAGSGALLALPPC